MTLRHLELFLALARTPNMREVATRFFLSQAAVSSSLRAFEEEIGATLFERSGRGLVLNEKGRLLEKRLGPVYGQLKSVLSLAAYDSLAGAITIGASTTLADFVIPQILYDFRKAHSDVTITCESGNTADIVHRVEEGVIDVGFVEGEVRNLNVSVLPLARESLLVVTADRKLAEQGPCPIASLMGKHWLLREQGSGTREAFLDKITPRGLRPSVFLEFNHNDPIKILLRNQDTLACLSRRIVERELVAQELFGVAIADAQFTRTFYRVEHKDRQPSALVEVLSDAIQSYMEVS